MGRRPVQFLYFDANLESYEKVLKPLPKGWLATSSAAGPILEMIPEDQLYSVSDGRVGLTAIHLGARSVDSSFEEGLLEKAVGRQETYVTVLIQKKFAEMHLAATAILNELEDSHETLTEVDLEELFELDGRTILKEFELVDAERDLDLGRYITLATPKVRDTLDRLCGFAHVVTSCAVENGKAVSLRRVSDTEVSLSRLAVSIASLFERISAELTFLFRMTSSSGDHVVAMRDGDVTYVVLLDGEAKPAMAAAEMLDLLSEVRAR